MRNAQLSIGLGLVLAALGCGHGNGGALTPANETPSNGGTNPSEPAGVATDVSRTPGGAGGSSGVGGGASN